MDIYDLIKSSKAYTSFIRDAENNRVSHANIVYARDNFFLQKITELYACYLLCNSQEKPCLKCKNCNRVIKGIHPDYHKYPLKNDKMLVEDIDDITENIAYMPSEGNIKIYVILHGETLNSSSQNKLLKTLEEPEKTVYIFIASNNIENLLPTVRSRCRIYEAELFSADGIYGYLINNNVDIKTAKIVSVSCGGLIGKAIEMTGNEQYLTLYNYIYKLFYKLKSYDDVLDCVQFLSVNKEQQEIFDIMQLYFKDCLMSINGKDDLILNKGADIKRQTENFTTKNIINFIEKTTEAKRKLSLNCNFTPVLETLLNEIVHFKNANQEDLI